MIKDQKIVGKIEEELGATIDRLAKTHSQGMEEDMWLSSVDEAMSFVHEGIKLRLQELGY
jgi:hypothetical protein